MMRILKTWECDASLEIEKIKQGLDPLNSSSDIRTTVLKIIQDVKKNGDKAIAVYGKRFDKALLSPEQFRVKEEEIEDAYKYVTGKFIKAIRLAIKNIQTYQNHIRIQNVKQLRSKGVILDTLYTPIDSAGIYVPGGAASYPSTVLMNAIPAQVAGVEKIVMVSPPKEDGNIPPERLVAAKEAGVSEIYKIGGVQAIAALAFGTKTIPRVDKIVGPGNVFVTLAKKEIFGYAGIDMLAGPSEVLIIADNHANPSYIASDLLSQAEHTPGISLLVTSSKLLAKQVVAEITLQIKTLSRSAGTNECLSKYGVIFIAKNMNECIALSNAIAPEHLQIMTQNPKSVLSGIKHAGAVFVGDYTPVALGDYIAGPSHVLPTGGTARFSSGLSANDFIKRTSVITYSQSALRSVQQDVSEISASEGLDAHAKSVKIRLATGGKKPSVR
ncbi:histidinol dehydrogenase [Candidatus Kuenenia sp.]|uniref:histidinol dehydrogenase n=1 Tax=Candidatus Kuenenia sp. TaxID=2499824 RepID=UPI00321FEEA2